MPITKENYRAAEEAIERAKANNVSPAAINRMQMALNSFYENYGHELDTPEVEEPEVLTSEPERPSVKYADTTSYGYHMEPSVEQFRKDIVRPEVRKRLGIGQAQATNVAGDYIASKVPELRGITDVSTTITPEVASQLGRESPEYKAYAEDAYKQSLENNPEIIRSRDIDPMENPLDFAKSRYLESVPSLAMGLEQGIGGGILSGIARRMSPTANETIEKYQNMSPTAMTVGQVAGSVSPIAVSNVAANAATKVIPKLSNPVARHLAGGGIAGAVAASEGVTQDWSQNPEHTIEENLETAVYSAPAAFGLGTVGSLAADAASAGRQALRESPRFEDVNTLKNAGGGTHVIRGVFAPPQVKENIRLGTGQRAVTFPADVAAEKVAPQIQESIQNRLDKTVKQIGGEVEAYRNNPQYQAMQENLQPAFDAAINMVMKGHLTKASGLTAAANPKMAQRVNKLIKDYADVNQFTPADAREFVRNQGGRILSPEESRVLGLPVEEGNVNVLRPANVNPDQLLALEDSLAEELKYAAKKGGIDNPILQEFNRNLKVIRDKFPYFQDSTPPVNATAPTEMNLDSQRFPTRTPTPPPTEAVNAPDTGDSLPSPFESITPEEMVEKSSGRPVDFDLSPEEYAAGVHEKPVTPERLSDLKRNYETFLQDWNDPNRIKAVQADNERNLRLQQSLEAEGYQMAPIQDYPHNPEASANESNKMMRDADLYRVKKAMEKERGWPVGWDEAGDTRNNPYWEQIRRERQNPVEDYSREFMPEHLGGNRIFPSPNFDFLSKDNPFQPAAAPWQKITAADEGIEELTDDMIVDASSAPVNSARNTPVVQSTFNPWKPKSTYNPWKEQTPTPVDSIKQETPIVPDKTTVPANVDQQKNTPVNYPAPYTPKKPEVQTPKQQAPKQESLFPDVPDQVGIPEREELLKQFPSVHPSKVIPFIKQTDNQVANLTPEELDAVHSYTRRKGDKVGTPEWESAAKKLTIKNPTQAGPIYSGTRMNTAELNRLLQNKYMNLTEDRSFSFNPEVSGAFAASRPQRGAEKVIFKLDDVDDGISLASKKLGIGGTSGEQEILLRNKSFEVVRHYKNKDGDNVVEIKQARKQPEATLKSGKNVRGLSAMRRKHELALEELETATSETGANSPKGIRNRVINFRKDPGQTAQNQALLDEAKKLGLEDRLWETAATRVYPELAARAGYDSQKGFVNALKDAATMRLDPFLAAIAGEQANPFVPKALRSDMGAAIANILNQKYGIGGSRFGTEIGQYAQEKYDDKE